MKVISSPDFGRQEPNASPTTELPEAHAPALAAQPDLTGVHVTSLEVEQTTAGFEDAAGVPGRDARAAVEIARLVNSMPECWIVSSAPPVEHAGPRPTETEGASMPPLSEGRHSLASNATLVEVHSYGRAGPGVPEQLRQHLLHELSSGNPCSDLHGDGPSQQAARAAVPAIVAVPQSDLHDASTHSHAVAAHEEAASNHDTLSWTHLGQQLH